MAERHGSNDSPGALGTAEVPGRGRSPSPGGRWLTTMSAHVSDGLNSRSSTDALAVITRADRAYHDVAQFHLHEFAEGDQ